MQPQATAHPNDCTSQSSTAFLHPLTAAIPTLNAASYSLHSNKLTPATHTTHFLQPDYIALLQLWLQQQHITAYCSLTTCKLYTLTYCSTLQPNPYCNHKLPLMQPACYTHCSLSCPPKPPLLYTIATATVNTASMYSTVAFHSLQPALITLTAQQNCHALPLPHSTATTLLQQHCTTLTA